MAVQDTLNTEYCRTVERIFWATLDVRQTSELPWSIESTVAAAVFPQTVTIMEYLKMLQWCIFAPPNCKDLC